MDTRILETILKVLNINAILILAPLWSIPVIYAQEVVEALQLWIGNWSLPFFCLFYPQYIYLCLTTMPKIMFYCNLGLNFLFLINFLLKSIRLKLKG